MKSKNRPALGIAALLCVVMSACEPVVEETPFLVGGPTTSPTPGDIPSATVTPTPPVQILSGTAVIPPTPTYAPPLPSAYVRNPPQNAYAVLGAGVISEAAISPESAYLAVENAGVSVYRTDTFERVWGVSLRARDLAWSPDGRRLAGRFGDSVYIWLGHTGERINLLDRPGETIDRFAWSPDGARIAAITGYTAAKELPPVQEGVLLIWNSELGTPLANIKLAGGISAFSWSPDGRYVAVSSLDRVQIYNAASGSLEQQAQVIEPVGLAWSPDSQRLAVSAQTSAIAVLDAASLAPATGYQPIGTSSVMSLLAWSPDGRWLAGASRSELGIWDAISGQVSQFLSIPDDAQPAINSTLNWSSDARKLILSRKTNNGLIIETATGQIIANFEERHRGQVMMSHDGNLIVSVTGALTAWRPEPMVAIFQQQGTAPIGTLSFSPDGASLFSGSPFGIVQWDVANARPVRSLYLPQVDSVRNEWQVGNIGIYPALDKLNLSLARADDADAPTRGSIELELATGNYAMTVDPTGILKPQWWPTGMIAGNTWSADGTMLANANTSGGSGITVLDTASGAAKSIGASELNAAATRIAFSPNGRFMAALADGDLICWNLSTGFRLFQIRGQHVSEMAWSGDGKLLAMAVPRSGGGRILLWDVVNARLLPTIEGHSDQVTALAFSPEGNFLASGSADGTIILWIMQPVTEQP